MYIEELHASSNKSDCTGNQSHHPQKPEPAQNKCTRVISVAMPICCANWIMTEQPKCTRKIIYSHATEPLLGITRGVVDKVDNSSKYVDEATGYSCVWIL